jgi:hypothetical protein
VYEHEHVQYAQALAQGMSVLALVLYKLAHEHAKQVDKLVLAQVLPVVVLVQGKQALGDGELALGDGGHTELVDETIHDLVAILALVQHDAQLDKLVLVRTKIRDMEGTHSC